MTGGLCFLVVMRKTWSISKIISGFPQGQLGWRGFSNWRIMQCTGKGMGILWRLIQPVSHPAGFPAFTFTCWDTSCPLFYLPKVFGSQHPIPFPIPFLQQSWAGIPGAVSPIPSSEPKRCHGDVSPSALLTFRKVTFDVLSNKDPATFFVFFLGS